MDWKQFITSIIGSLAWPIVVLILLFMIRKQLAGLAESLTEFSFLGGKAKFDRELAKGREVMTAIENLSSQGTTPTLEKKITISASGDPMARIIQAYEGIEETIKIVRGKLDIAPNFEPQVVMDFLSQDPLAPQLGQLFLSLRAARNSVVHGRFQPTDNEADEYVKQAEVLKEALRVVTRDLA